jgi:solute:Na+ symporter, SSS family
VIQILRPYRCFLRCLFLFPVPLASFARAQEVVIAQPITPRGLTWIDCGVIALYFAAVLGLGAYISRRQVTNAEYFTAAKTHIHPILAGISFFAALLSTITYLGFPGEVINKGPMALVGELFSIPIAYLVVGYWIVPRIMKQRVTSAYELLEWRLGRTSRVLGALLFVKLRLIWMGLLVYIGSTALTIIINVDLKWVPLVSVVIGIVPLIYASMGGLRAVVIANVIQFTMLLFGALLTITIITIRCGGFSWWPTTWSAHWDAQPIFSLDPYIRVTVVGAVLSPLVWRICTAGGDQMAIQHYMATRDAAATRRLYLVASLATVVVVLLLAILGMALLGFFSRFPELMRSDLNLASRADYLFPYFISNFLPAGVTGLLVAAILAASSGMDTGVNAVTAVVMKDFLERSGWNPADERARLRTTKWMSFGIGLLVVAASMFVGKVPGNFLEMTSKLASLETTTLFGLFFLALFVPCATPLGALTGAIYGLTVSIVVAFWDLITGRPAISFLYIGIIGLFFNLTVGYAVSRFGPRRENVHANAIAGTVLLALLVIGVAVVCAA